MPGTRPATDARLASTRAMPAALIQPFTDAHRSLSGKARAALSPIPSSACQAMETCLARHERPDNTAPFVLDFSS